MDDRIPGLIFGIFLSVLGTVMLMAQLRARKPTRDDLRLAPHDRRFLDRRSRRRMQVAGLIILIGVMIPVGDALIPWKDAPGTFAVYWMIVIALAMWTLLCGLSDMLATRLHSQVSLDRIKAEQQHLEETVQRLRDSRKSRSDGPTLE